MRISAPFSDAATGSIGRTPRPASSPLVAPRRRTARSVPRADAHSTASTGAFTRSACLAVDSGANALNSTLASVRSWPAITVVGSVCPTHRALVTAYASASAGAPASTSHAVHGSANPMVRPTAVSDVPSACACWNSPAGLCGESAPGTSELCREYAP